MPSRCGFHQIRDYARQFLRQFLQVDFVLQDNGQKVLWKASTCLPLLSRTVIRCTRRRRKSDAKA